MTEQIARLSEQVASQYVKNMAYGGVHADYFKLRRLDEATAVQVADSILSDMFKFITDKYNSLDFKEIENSRGDYSRFKYRAMIDENLKTLLAIYRSSNDSGANKYRALISDINEIIKWLDANRKDISYLVMKRRGIIEVTYTTMVASVLFGVAALVANTIRAVTVDKGADLEVLFDEVPNAYKNVHIQNITNIAKSLPDFTQLLVSTRNYEKKHVMTEAARVEDFANLLTKGAAAVSKLAPKGSTRRKVIGAAAAVAAVVWAAPKIFMLVRQVIFVWYYSRATISEAIELNATLIKANIEVLENTGGSPKVITAQRAMMEKLQRLALVIANKSDRGEILAKREIARENDKLEEIQPERFNTDDYGNEILI